MNPRKFALFGGILMLALGVVALIPSLSQLTDSLPLLRVNNSYGMFLGFIPMNIVNKVLLMVLGIWGIAAAASPGTSLPASITYSRAIFMMMALFAVMGLFPQTNTLFGYAPLFGNYVWVHAVIAVVGAYFGYALTTKTADEREVASKRSQLSVNDRDVQPRGI